MQKMMINYCRTAVFLLIYTTISHAQVGIGTTSPNASSALDITSANSGILIPRVSLLNNTDVATIPSPATSLLVYNSGFSPNGYYYWNGVQWVQLAVATVSTDWSLNGNSGTTAGTNYLGTSDAVDIRFKTGATDRWNISHTNNGQLQSYDLGTATVPTYSFQSDQNTGLFSSGADALDITTGGIARFRFPNVNQVHALNLGTAALPFYSFSADTGIGMWSPAASTLAFSTTGLERIRFFSDGRVAINSTTPFASDRFSVYASAGQDAVNGFSSTTGTGVYGENTGTGIGVYGTSVSTGVGVYGDNAGTGSGVFGSTTGATGAGVFGQANVNSGAGVYGQSNGTLASGVEGFASGSGGAGVYGSTNGAGGSTGVTGYTTGTSSNSYGVWGVNAATSSGTAFTPTTACVAGVMGDASQTGSYKFGIYGYGGRSTRSGGVIGNDLGVARGAVGYYSSGSLDYSLYGFGTAVFTGAAAGRMASNQLEKNTHIGLGIYGGVMGGWVRGLKYGFHTKGETYSLYIDGNGYTNKPFALLTETDREKVATFMTTSTKPEVTCKGKSKLADGKAFITFNSDFSKIISNVDDIIINVTPQGNSKGVFVSDVTKEGFWIYENENGNSNINIFWSASATIKSDDRIKVPADLLAKDFDSKMDGVMFNDDYKDGNAQSLWWDGSSIRWDKPEERTNVVDQKQPVIREKKILEKPKKQ